ncbi:MULTISPECIES: hypothetical protein [Cupriavidus]
MRKHTAYGITAEHTGADLFVTAHAPSENPLSLAAEKAAQLNALLIAAGEQAGGAACAGDMAREGQSRLLALAVGLAHETAVLSELAALGGEGRGVEGIS